MSPSVVIAAGAVCWRVVEGKIRVLLIHRDRHRDVSLPKGKLDPGESLPQAAVREIAEETGLSIALGAPLGTTEYALPGGRDKVVYYWTAEVDEETHASSTFVPGEEVARVEWLSLKKARKALSYPHDREVLDRFQARVENVTLRTFALVLLRHGKAVPPSEFDGPDAERLLRPLGQKQAKEIAPGLAAYRPLTLISSTAARCLATIAPLAKRLGLSVKKNANLSQDAYDDGAADVAAVVARRLERRRSAVLCSHAPVLPELLAEIARQTNTPVDNSVRRAAALSPADYTVVHLSRERPDAGIIALETHAAGR